MQHQERKALKEDHCESFGNHAVEIIYQQNLHSVHGSIYPCDCQDIKTTNQHHLIPIKT